TSHRSLCFSVPWHSSSSGYGTCSCGGVTVNKYALVALLAVAFGFLALVYLVVDALKLNTAAIMAFIVLILLPVVGIAAGLFWLQARRPPARQEPQPRPQSGE